METLYRVGSVVFGDWKIIREIGHGTYGNVYVIEKQDTYGLQVRSALKVIKIPPDRYADDDSAAHLSEKDRSTFYKSCVDKMVQEIQTMTRLRGAENIVRYEDHDVIYDEWDGRWYILIRMELLEESLSRLMKKRVFGEQEILQVGLDISKALADCENVSVMHRDIKPANILRNENGHFKLGDFGVARVMDGTSKAGTVSGTENYMAPEILRGERYDRTVDMYSLGIVMYQLANKNRFPFYPEEGKLDYQAVDNASQRRLRGETFPTLHGIRKELADIILKACAYRPKDRYPSASQMYRELYKLADQITSDPKREKERKSKRRRRIFAAVTAVLLAMAVAAFVFFTIPLPDFSLYRNTIVYRGHTYLLFDMDDYNITTYSEAQSFCKYYFRNGYLSRIDDKEENDRLYRFVIDYGYPSAYFGLSDERTEGVFLLSDGTEVQYENWAPEDDQPDNWLGWERQKPEEERDGEDYVQFYTVTDVGTWNDVDFKRHTTMAICEWDRFDILAWINTCFGKVKSMAPEETGPDKATEEAVVKR